MELEVEFHDIIATVFTGHKWLIERLPPGTSVLRIGGRDPWFNAADKSGRLDVTFTGELSRSHIPRWACRAKIGVVCDDGQHDSGPRILPELLAMNIPVLVRQCVRADLDAYVVPETGIVVDGMDFPAAFKLLLDGWTERHPRRYYLEHLSLDHAAARILGLVRRLKEGK